MEATPDWAPQRGACRFLKYAGVFHRECAILLSVMPPHVFNVPCLHTSPHVIRFTSGGHVELLSTVVERWVERVAAGRSYVWKQDSAPRHTSGKSQTWP